jgi:hypothetical protein
VPQLSPRSIAAKNIESKKVHDAERFRNDAPQRQRTGADEHSEEAEARLEYFADNRASHPFRDACDRNQR